MGFSQASFVAEKGLCRGRGGVMSVLRSTWTTEVVNWRRLLNKLAASSLDPQDAQQVRPVLDRWQQLAAASRYPSTRPAASRCVSAAA